MIKTVTFKDEGQDFLEWDIEYPDTGDMLSDFVGEVIACRPCQEAIWKGAQVYLKDIHVGDFLPFVSAPSYGLVPSQLTLKHPVENVKEQKGGNHAEYKRSSEADRDPPQHPPPLVR